VSDTAVAFYTVRPGLGELRTVKLPTPGPEDVLVKTMWTGISRGTETLVFRGEVPARQYAAMRAPHQDGEFPGPVKYGYLNVGEVQAGPDHLRGRTVFCLYPHQDRYVVPATAVTPLPDSVPPRRGVLAGTVETAVNALWDAAPLIGDRIAVVGAGMVGCCLARLLAGIPGASIVLIDVDPGRAVVAEALEVEFAGPAEAAASAGSMDLVFHTSATAAGLQLALDLLSRESTVVELSWYGDRSVSVHLGGSFHSDRLSVRASQVGRVSPSRQATRTTADRLALSLQLLADPAFDALLTGPSEFPELPATMAALARGTLDALCQTVTYQAAGESAGFGG
jgi:threonine dehydrogenase-like Zn-dependent dehydrogenase